MNHYANDAENRRLDDLALDALERLDPADLYYTVSDHHISMCGLLPAVIGLETLRQLGSLKECRRVAYATSGEVSGDYSRVVGYAGILQIAGAPVADARSSRTRGRPSRKKNEPPSGAGARRPAKASS